MMRLSPIIPLVLFSVSLSANEMILVPAGTFEMGHATIAPPIHQVTLTHDYYLSETEITNAEYLKLLQWAYDQDYLTITGGWVQQHNRNLLPLDDGYQEIQFDSETETFYLRESPCSLAQSAYPDGYDPAEHPVNVSCYGAACYCDWLSEVSGLIPFYQGDFTSSPSHNPYEAEGYRLCTEAEWEHAARYDNGDFMYPWGNNTLSCSYANHSRCVTWSVPVGTYPSGVSQLGFLEMSGNVWEWTNDWAGSYPSAPQIDPYGPTSGSSIECRGGSWNCWGQPYHTVWWRHSVAASGVGVWTVGFRSALMFVDIPTDVDAPQHCYLMQNYPNPFNPATTIAYGLDFPGHVSIRVFDLSGRQVVELFNGEQIAGEHLVEWHPVDISSGIYFVKLTSGEFSDIRKVTCLK